MEVAEILLLKEAESVQVSQRIYQIPPQGDNSVTVFNRKGWGILGSQ